MKSPFIEAHSDYFESGIRSITVHKNAGSLMAFQDKSLNEDGLSLHRSVFLDIFKKYQIDISLRNIPTEFVLYIKYSPISLFKKWIFHLSNHSLLKVSQRDKQFSVEFFLYPMNDVYTVIPLSTNVAHERFLYYLYQKETFENYHSTFKTAFNERHSLVLYKDYFLIKEYVISIKQVIPHHLYTFDVNVSKTFKQLTYTLTIDHEKTKSYLFLLSPNHMHFKETRLSPKKASASLQKTDRVPTSVPKIDVEKYYQEVIHMLKTFHNAKRRTNKFANIALGRVNKVPVLINLSSHYKDYVIQLKYAKDKLHIYNDKQELIKTLVVSRTPKSNWLCKEKK